MLNVAVEENDLSHYFFLPLYSISFYTLCECMCLLGKLYIRLFSYMSLLYGLT